MAGMDASGKMVTAEKEEETGAGTGKAKSASSRSGTRAKSAAVKAAADEAPEGVAAAELEEKAEVKE